MSAAPAPVTATASPDELLEAVWAERGRRVVGRELRLELLIGAAFLAAAGTLASWSP